MTAKGKATTTKPKPNQHGIKMCLFPRLIQNPKYKANKKNGGQVPPVSDERVKLVPVGCQKCIECRKQKASWWITRLTEDIKVNKNAKFMTLTFNSESLFELTMIILEKDPELKGYHLENEIATLAVRRFLERWRKTHKTSVRHWLITELGKGRYEHLHLHGLIWTDEPKEVINKHWKYGFTWAGEYVNESTIAYITKYFTKVDPLHKSYTPIILTSAGIGRNYMNRTDWERNKYNGAETNTKYRTNQGKEIQLPTYYRNKIYTEEEREKLWLHMLDKNERYVLGNRIDISKDETEYWKALEYAQRKNQELGYGGNPLDWEQELYEKERINLKRKERLEKKIQNNKKKNKKQ